jgi:hybrid cluster-associated redox disulfide protein
MLYYKTSQPVPGKGEAWVFYECNDSFEIVRHMTYTPATGELECVSKPLVRKMTDMWAMQGSSAEEFEELWEDPPEGEEQGSHIEYEEGKEYFRLDMPIAEAMAVHPRVREVFAAFRLGGCGSCGVGEVETVGQVCAAYGVDADLLLEVLDDLIRPKDEAPEEAATAAENRDA